MSIRTIKRHTLIGDNTILEKLREIGIDVVVMGYVVVSIEIDTKGRCQTTDTSVKTQATTEVVPWFLQSECDSVGTIS